MAPKMSDTAHMATTTLLVKGMTCGACTSSVEAAFQDIAGIGTVSVSLVMERAVVQHDPKQKSAEEVKELIEDRGFDAEVVSTDIPIATVDIMEDVRLASDEPKGPRISTTTLSIEGMTCGACTSSVEGGFKEVAGIRAVSVSLLAGRAVVEHDALAITPEAVAEIIEDRGFGATVLEIRAAQSAETGAARRTTATKTDLTTTIVAVDGMTCGACTSAIEGGFRDLKGVVSFKISLLAERAVVVHDASTLSAEAIINIIEDRGFDGKIVSSEHAGFEKSSTTSNVQLKIYGLRDSTSATALQSTLNQLPGVQACIVHLASSRATITYNSAVIGLRALVQSVDALGYNALLAESEDNAAQLESLAKTREIQEWRRAARTSACFAIPVFLISMILPKFFATLDFGSWVLWPGLYLGDVICFVLTLPVQFGIGWRFYVSSYRSAKHGALTMDVLVVLGTSAAFFFSIAAIIVSMLYPPHSRPKTSFETSTMLISFITLGRYLENRAKGQTSKALSQLMSLAPSMATIYADPIAAQKAAEEWDRGVAEKDAQMAEHRSKAAEEQVVPTELLELGDVVILRPGDKIPADGTVTHGTSYVDESMVTGEAMPISKRTGSVLMAGTVNGTGRLDFLVTRAGRDTQLSQIVKLVQEAQTTRAPIQRMADLVASYFVPIILGLGGFTFVTWIILSHALPHPPKVFLEEQSGGRFMVCVKLCISVIVFACPCALGLSTPTAVMVGTGVGATHGILVKGGAALETATKITHLVFDKTGTLTVGKMSVAETTLAPLWQTMDWRRRLWWSLVGLAEMGSEHPIGKAIVSAAKDALQVGSDGMIDGTVGDFQATVGHGISAFVEPSSSIERTRYHILIGNALYLESQGVAMPTEAKAAANILKPSTPTSTTAIHIAIDSAYAGTLHLSDSVKPTSRATILALNRMHITSYLVTGDQAPSAHHVASIVGIPRQNVHSGVSPDQKQALIKQLQAAGHTVAMVGDGINDSPALATADIGIALSSGTDVAMEAADIVLMRADDLLNVPAALCLARTIFRRIKMNLAWACLYNLFGLPFAMGIGLALPGGFMLPPMASGAAMAMSSVSVVVSSLLLKFWQRPTWLSVERLEAAAGVPNQFATAAASGDDEEAHMLGDMRKASVGSVNSISSVNGAAGLVLGRVKRLFLTPGPERDGGYIPLVTAGSARSEAFGDFEVAGGEV